MAKNIHQQIIDGKGEVSRNGEIKSFNHSTILVEAKDILQDENALVQHFKSHGILLAVFHEAFKAWRVSWAAHICTKAKGKSLNDLPENIGEDFIPKVMNLPKTEKMSEAKALKALAEAKGITVEQLEALLTKI